jgi:uncharacterized membrane protein
MNIDFVSVLISLILNWLSEDLNFKNEVLNSLSIYNVIYAHAQMYKSDNIFLCF